MNPHTMLNVRIGCLALALIGIGRCVQYLPRAFDQEEVPLGIAIMSGVIPLLVWSILWLVAGLLAIVGGLWRHRPVPVFTVGIAAMSGVWTIAHVAGVIVGGSRYLGSSLLFLGIATVTTVFVTLGAQATPEDDRDE